MNLPAERQAPPPLILFQEQVDARAETFRQTLPAHIPWERFRRVLIRAVQKNPDLIRADRASVINAAIDAANDGLLPDGREGAMVMFKDKAQWMPMVGGILKKIRNSGELKSLTARLVYAGDHFRYWVDESGEHLEFEPADSPDKSMFRRAFALAVTTDGGSYIEVMDADDIEKVRNVSRAKNAGPWRDWWEEMVKKTVIRRLAKRLPISTDLDDLIRRDDALYDLDGASDARRAAAPKTLAGRLDALADGPAMDQDNEDAAGGDGPAAGDAPGEAAASQPAGGGADSSHPAPPAGTGDADPADEAERAGVSAARKGMARDAIPPAYSKDKALKAAWLAGYDSEGA